MAKIVFISPNRELSDFAKTILGGPSDIDFVIGLLDKAEELVTRSAQQGAEVVVTRGGTALTLKEHVCGITVVEIPVTAYDILRAAAKARALGNKVALIGFPNMVRRAVVMCPLFGIDLVVKVIERQQDALPLIQEAVQEGADVIMGGVLTTSTASSLGVKVVVVDWGKEAIQEAVGQARWLVDVRDRERAKTEELKAILNYTSGGIIGVDRHGRIEVVNVVAERILGKKAVAMIGKPVDSVLPPCRASRVMDLKHAELGQVVQLNNDRVEINCVPVLSGKEVSGAIVTLHPGHKQKEQGSVTFPRAQRFQPYAVVGSSPAFVDAWEKARKYAATDSTILILGETGTGKELFARWIHKASRRSRGPFVAINCAALAENLLESELFGYRDGAFTGARKGGTSGLFLEANGGTLFLDEVAEISLRVQGSLLRVLEEKAVRPVGGEKAVSVDVRVIAATNRNLLEAVNKGQFRADLFYRLNVLTVNIPPLRERKEDIALLANHFLASFSARYGKKMQLSPEALGLLQAYPWPGNVRELENVMERLSILIDSPVISRWQVLEVLPQDTSVASEGETVEVAGTWKEIQQQLVQKALSLSGGRKHLAARRLGVSRTFLWRMNKNKRG